MLHVTSGTVGLLAMTKFAFFAYKACSRVRLFSVSDSDTPISHITSYYIIKAARNKGMYQSFSTFFAKIFPYPPDIVQIIECSRACFRCVITH